jgi:hypothetical protein
VIDAVLQPELAFGLAAGLLALPAGVWARSREWFGAALAIGVLVPIALRGGLPPAGPSTIILVVASAAAGGYLILAHQRSHRTVPATVSLLAGSAAGVFLVVPDTEQALVLTGVLLPAGLVGLGRPISVGITGSFALAACLAWVVATDGKARESAVVGGLACLGIFLLGPVARLGRGILPGGSWIRFSLHAALVVFASRVAGRAGSWMSALAMTIAALAVAAVVSPRPTPVLSRSSRPKRASPPG